MAVELLDVLKANLVLVGLNLLPTETETEAFRRAVGVEVVERPALNSGADPIPVTTSRLLALDRERTFLDLSPARDVVVRNYPESTEDFERIAEIATLAIEKTDVREVGETVLHGYNFDMVFSQDSDLPAPAYLASRLFGTLLPQRMGWTLEGGIASLVFRDTNGRQWTFSPQPRAFDPSWTRLFLGLNLQVEAQPLPSRDEILQVLLDCREQAIRLMSTLDWVH